MNAAPPKRGELNKNYSSIRYVKLYEENKGFIIGCTFELLEGKEYRGPLLQRMPGLSMRADDYGADNVGSIKLIV